jgi:hypothetical protein
VAQHTEVRLVDDLDGSDAVETVTFVVDGKLLEIDLSEAHAAQLRPDFYQLVRTFGLDDQCERLA